MMNWIELSGLLLCAAAVAGGCSSEDGADGNAGGAPGADGGAGAAGAAGAGTDGCALVARSCPTECDVVVAQTIDAERGCSSTPAGLGCWDPNEARTDDLACIRDAATGTTYQLASGSYAAALAETDEFETCSSDEDSVAVGAVECEFLGFEPNDCPLGAVTCPAGCVVLEGQAIDNDNECVEAPVQLGCFPEDGVRTRNGGCVLEVATGTIWVLETATYQQQLLSSPDYSNCGIDAIKGPDTLATPCTP